MGVFTENPKGGALPGEGGGGGPGVCTGNLGGGGGGGAGAPFTVKMSPLFGENALNSGRFGVFFPTPFVGIPCWTLPTSHAISNCLCTFTIVMSACFSGVQMSVLSNVLPLIGRKHPSRDVIFSGQNLAKKCQKLSLYMTSSNL